MDMQINPKKSALLIMHYQNGIVNPEAAFSVVGTAASVQRHNCIEKTAAALEASRDAGMMIVFANFELRAGWPEIKKPPFPLIANVKENTFIRGDWDATLPDELKPKENEVIILNFNSNCFLDSDLDRILRVGKIEHLFLAGVATNFVVESTARYAVEIGYDATVLEDLCASFKDEWHDFAITQILPYWCNISKSEDFIGALPKR